MHAELHGDIVVEVFDLKFGAEDVTQWVLQKGRFKREAGREEGEEDKIRLTCNMREMRRKKNEGKGTYRETIMSIEECVKSRSRHPPVPICCLLYRLIRHIFIQPQPHILISLVQPAKRR